MPSYAPSQSSVIVEWGQSRDMEVIGWALGGIIRWKSCSVGEDLAALLPHRPHPSAAHNLVSQTHTPNALLFC